MSFTAAGARHGRARTIAQADVLATSLIPSRFSVLAATVAGVTLFASSVALNAQGSRRDSTSRARADSVQPLERVIISAIRGPGSAPISATSISRSTIERRNFGQDVPLLLQGAAPSLTAYAESGTNWGYSYLRLRGIDQSRINITMDGVPLNDSEDQVLYFADFPDLSSSLQSVQVQRGVGTSSAGTASFAGSVNFETTALALRNRGGEAQLQMGSFGARRAMLSYSSGLLANRLAAHVRFSAQQTNGYRNHSGVYGRSAFLSAGYFGDRDILKLTATAGLMRDTLSYLAVPVAQLASDRRFNPLGANELDSFGEQLVSLGYTRLLSDASSVSTTMYRLSAAGNYDVAVNPDLYNYRLDFATYGVTSALHHDGGNVRTDVGLNASTYAREHEAALRPSLATPLYQNTGHKQEVSAFLKSAWSHGNTTWFGDLQVRRPHFRYEPDAQAGIGEASISWAFVNPKLGVTVNASPALNYYASFGITTREPTRSDMFAGADNMDASNAGSISDLTRVHPERVYNTEAGARWQGAHARVNANLYSMEFRNEIAPIGALSLTGSPLRRNVARSYRRGVEVDASWQASDRLTIAGNLTWSLNRIRSYTDSSGDAPVTYTNVAPLLTPQLLMSKRAEWNVSRYLAASLEGRYQSRAFLTNTGNGSLMLPDYAVIDGALRLTVRGQSIVVRGANLGNTKKFSSGYDNGDGPAYYILPPRSLFVTAQIGF